MRKCRTYTIGREFAFFAPYYPKPMGMIVVDGCRTSKPRAVWPYTPTGRIAKAYIEDVEAVEAVQRWWAMRDAIPSGEP